MNLNISYDATTLSTAPSGFFSAVNYVVNLFNATFTANVTVNIQIGYGTFPYDNSAVPALGESMQNNLAFVNYGIVWAVVLTDRYLESKGFGSHAKVVHLTVANPIRVEELDALLPAGTAEFEKVRIDKEAHLVTVTAQVRVKPGDVDNLLEGLRRNEKVRAFEIE